MNTKFLTKIVPVAMVMCTASAMAQEPFADVIGSIVANNADIKGQRELMRAQADESADANSLSNPEVAFSRVWGSHNIGNKLQLDVSQGFEWPGVYRLRSLAASQGLSAAELQVMASTLDLRLEAKELLTELVYVRKTMQLQLDMQASMQAMMSHVEQASQARELTILDEKKLRYELYTLGTELAQTQSRQSQVAASLQALASGAELDLSRIAEYPIEPVLTAEQYASQVTELDPLLSSQRMMAEQEATNARAAGQQRFPSFSVGYQHQAEMGDRFNGFTVGMSLPFFENRKARSAALHRRNAAELSADMMVAQKAADVQSTLADMDIWRRQIEAYHQAQADGAYLELLAKAYDGGELTVLQYLQEVQYFMQITQSYLDAEYNYHKALATLNKYSLLDD